MLDFYKIEFGLLSAQKRKVRIYIFLQLSKGKKLSCPLQLFINPSFWQDKNQRVSPRYKEAAKINEKLKIVRFQISLIVVFFILYYYILPQSVFHALRSPGNVNASIGKQPIVTFATGIFTPVAVEER